MYGLPEDFEVDVLNGRTLEMACISQHQISFHLSEKLLISVEGEISVGNGGRLRLPSSISVLYPLLEKKVVASHATTEGTLTLYFEQGATLQIYDSSREFESYSIVQDGNTLVIV